MTNSNKYHGDYLKFENWLNNILEKSMPQNIVAYNFNLYEGSENTYDIHLIGSNIYEEDDDDWACNSDFTSGTNICYLERTEEIKAWNIGLEYIIELIKKYIVEGKYRTTLLKVNAIAVGFVDGDLEILYKK